MEKYLRSEVPLSQLTTFEVGGPARWVAAPQTLEELTQTVNFARQQRLPLYPVGGGSNILASDRGFAGVVIQPQLQGLEVKFRDGYALVRAQAGVEWDDLVAYCVERNLAGIECLSAIPGKVGAAPVQNIGAYGQEVGQTVESVQVLNVESLELEEIPARKCAFAYRTSRFKTEWRGRYIITALTLCLIPQGPPTLRYQDLQLFFADQLQADPSWRPSLAEVRQAVIAVRRSKAMTYDPQNPNHRCAGSFFLNPVVPQEQVSELKERYPQMPVYPAARQGWQKLSAAWLVAQAGFPKGYASGRAALSSAHTLVLINPGQAQAQDILDLAQEIRAKVQDTFQVELVPEPNLLGFE